MYKTLATPAVLIDLDRMQSNITAMQDVCASHGVELRPHIKTHKMIEVARRQLAAGAAGLTCAKIGEAEAMLPSGVRSIFIAHSLVDPMQAPRLRSLHDALNELIVACTSRAHVPFLEKLLSDADVVLPVFIAVDCGLGREGVRSLDDAVVLAQLVSRQPHMQLKGFYTHEGHLYSSIPECADEEIQRIHEWLVAVREVVEAATGHRNLKIWPGCSVSAARMARCAKVDAVRPGAYVFGDMFLCDVTGVMTKSAVALTVLATVVDKPEGGLALIDAGSKTFSSDKTVNGISARALDGRGIEVVRCNEEHGYLRGADVDALCIGERIEFVPAHVCPVINLTDTVYVKQGGFIVDTWRVEGRGKVQ